MTIAHARRSAATTLLALWSATLLSALLVAFTPDLSDAARSLLHARLTATSTSGAVDQIVALVMHNAGIACWPLLLGSLISPRGRFAALGDITVAASLALNALLVGVALGAYGQTIVPYLPHLPFEWAALALGSSGWWTQRTVSLAPHQIALIATVACTLLLFAAALEVLAVPHH